MSCSEVPKSTVWKSLLAALLGFSWVAPSSPALEHVGGDRDGGLLAAGLAFADDLDLDRVGAVGDEQRTGVRDEYRAITQSGDRLAACLRAGLLDETGSAGEHADAHVGEASGVVGPLRALDAA